MDLSTDRFAQYLLMLSEHLQSSTVVHELWPVFQQRYSREVSFTAHRIQPTICSQAEHSGFTETFTPPTMVLPVWQGVSGTPVTPE